MKNKVIKIAKDYKFEIEFNIGLDNEKIILTKDFPINNQDKIAKQVADIYKKVTYLLVELENHELYIMNVKSNDIDFVSKSIKYEIEISQYPF